MIRTRDFFFFVSPLGTPVSLHSRRPQTHFPAFPPGGAFRSNFTPPLPGNGRLKKGNMSSCREARSSRFLRGSFSTNPRKGTPPPPPLLLLPPVNQSTHCELFSNTFGTSSKHVHIPKLNNNESWGCGTTHQLYRTPPVSPLLVAPDLLVLCRLGQFVPGSFREGSFSVPSSRPWLRPFGRAMLCSGLRSAWAQGHSPGLLLIYPLRLHLGLDEPFELAGVASLLPPLL